MPSPQSTGAFLMVRPTSFGFDEQTAVTNAFQYHAAAQKDIVRRLAEAEFDAYVAALRKHNIDVVVFEDTPVPPKPNGVFPNNWLTTFPDGRVFLYPMATESRRIERNPAVLEQLKTTFRLSAVHDLSAAEQQGEFLESTGVMVFDHPSKIAYACISPRCDEGLFIRHATDLGYTPVAFHAYDHDTPIYHTNVMMAIQSTTAVICGEAIPNATERQCVLQNLAGTGHEVVNITPTQLNQYCGNVLEVQDREGRRYLVLSSSAHAAFTPAQLRVLCKDKTLLPVALPTIQEVGGGSARCMVAEIFLPRITQKSLKV